MDIKALYFKDSRQWREWLQDNHDKQPEAWLLHYKKKSSRISVGLAEAVEEAICFGWIDGKLKSIDDESYMVKYTPRKVNSVWSRINRDRAQKLIKEGKMTAAGLAMINEAGKRGLWQKAYTNKKRDEIPSDLEEALRQDETARTNFQNFANSYRNMYIGWVLAARTEVTRQRRIGEVVRRSALNKKPGIE
jgi:uncharacterized protein YdeI (YjbR/CyaY-like superfamily)